MSVTLEGNAISLKGSLPAKGKKAPEFTLVSGDMEELHLKDFAGKKVVLNIFPSLDTDVCAQSVREFEKRILQFDNTLVLSISKDLPFAQKRFCLNENVERVKTLSAFRDESFGSDYGVEITDSPIKGLFSRAVVVLDEKGTVVYSEQVPEITQEPDYVKALEAL